ncbi:CPBP family intramembrane glutamic endopeptidase [Halobellus ordinarius]|uniref:CPBP family intramembrane glutamic endopeptidase n=1 Tax=Halobellus ordinarius TaxID=3075120 RepID=UPI0028808495|nr:type II CAAX endopeptidase family protein [Halobellus sp. ZY16]
MVSLVERRPVGFALGLTAALVVLTLLTRSVLEAAVPELTLHGIGLVLNWLIVAVSIGLVTWLGWWERIRLTAPVNRRAVVYLLPFAAVVFVPVAFGLAIPEISLIQGQTLPPWAALFVIIVGVALGAAISEELIYRGVLLRALEPRSRLLAVVLPATMFGLAHISQVILGNSLAEWLPQMLLIIPLGIGLGAIALRLESLWPLIVWHFAVDVTGSLAATTSVVYELISIGFVLLAGAIGVWLLWQDRRARRGPHRQPASTPIDELGVQK